MDGGVQRHLPWKCKSCKLISLWGICVALFLIGHQQSCLVNAMLLKMFTCLLMCLSGFELVFMLSIFSYSYSVVTYVCTSNYSRAARVWGMHCRALATCCPMACPISWLIIILQLTHRKYVLVSINNVQATILDEYHPLKVELEFQSINIDTASCFVTFLQRGQHQGYLVNIISNLMKWQNIYLWQY